MAAAVLHKDGTFLGTQRGYGEFEGGWEFPGGKIEEGESPQAALLRELKEELGIDAIVEQFLMTVECNYPDDALLFMLDCRGENSTERAQISPLDEQGTVR